MQPLVYPPLRSLSLGANIRGFLVDPEWESLQHIAMIGVKLFERQDALSMFYSFDKGLSMGEGFCFAKPH
jgi:hypothetical protein